MRWAQVGTAKLKLHFPPYVFVSHRDKSSSPLSCATAEDEPEIWQIIFNILIWRAQSIGFGAAMTIAGYFSHRQFASMARIIVESTSQRLWINGVQNEGMAARCSIRINFLVNNFERQNYSRWEANDTSCQSGNQETVSPFLFKSDYLAYRRLPCVHAACCSILYFVYVCIRPINSKRIVFGVFYCKIYLQSFCAAADAENRNEAM